MSAKRISVLIVEDDAWFAEQYTRLLQTEGYDVHTAPHALAAIDMLESYMPDVLVLDVLLPGVTGIALLHELQSYKDTAAIPIILCTSTASTIDPEAMKPYGVARVLDKATMTPDDIVAALRSVSL